jgi:hypothetical protein
MYINCSESEYGDNFEPPISPFSHMSAPIGRNTKYWPSGPIWNWMRLCKFAMGNVMPCEWRIWNDVVALSGRKWRQINCFSPSCASAPPFALVFTPVPHCGRYNNAKGKPDGKKLHHSTNGDTHWIFPSASRPHTPLLVVAVSWQATHVSLQLLTILSEVLPDVTSRKRCSLFLLDRQRGEVRALLNLIYIHVLQCLLSFQSYDPCTVLLNVQMWSKVTSFGTCCALLAQGRIEQHCMIRGLRDVHRTQIVTLWRSVLISPSSLAYIEWTRYADLSITLCPNHREM